MEELTEQAAALPASTLEGFKVKARLLQHHLRCGNRMDGKVSFSTPEEKMAWKLVHEMLGEVPT